MSVKETELLLGCGSRELSSARCEAAACAPPASEGGCEWLTLGLACRGVQPGAKTATAEQPLGSGLTVAAPKGSGEAR